jgi:serine phosphatase RsbU (regulator of sigma subunit)
MKARREMSPENWVAIGLFIATAILGLLCWLAQRFFNAADENLKQLPLIRIELATERVNRENDRRSIDHAHSRLDKQGEEIREIDKRVVRVEGFVVDTEQE